MSPPSGRDAAPGGASRRGALRAVPPPPLGEALELLRLVWGVKHGLERTSKRMERTLGITGPQRLVIRLLGRFPGLTLARMAALLEVHPSTASVVVKRLEQRGLVHRRADTRDRRRAYLGLTDAGRRLDTETEGTVEAAVHRTLAGLPRPSVEGARAVLETLARELGGGGPGDDGRR